jgi:mono/diheme cytochrome c family protein
MRENSVRTISILVLWGGALVCGPALSGQSSGQSGGEGAVAVTLPPSNDTFRPGPGAELAGTRCIICHSADYVYTQPPMSPEQWRPLVKKMQQAHGCPVSDGEVAALTAYLAAQNAPRK